ncbi:hypothetical protein C2U36_20630, partial [Escherichia coli]
MPTSTGPGGLYSSPCRFTGRSKRNNSSECQHHSRYDLATLCQVNPELRQFLTLTPAGEQSVDF